MLKENSRTIEHNLFIGDWWYMEFVARTKFNSMDQCRLATFIHKINVATVAN